MDRLQLYTKSHKSPIKASVDLTSPTCQGNSPLLASSPPTILLRPTLPHRQWGGGMGDTGTAFTNLLKIDKYQLLLTLAVAEVMSYFMKASLIQLWSRVSGRGQGAFCFCGIPARKDHSDFISAQFKLGFSLNDPQCIIMFR